MLQPLASGSAVLTEEDKNRGVVLVDIGGGTTDIAIFIGGGIWHTVVLPIGGTHFTNDLVYVLHTPHNTAEYLKLKYGSALHEPKADDQDEIDTDTFSPGERQQVSRILLNDILQSRAEQLIEMVGSEIRRSGYEGLLPAGIVLTGGSAQLPGLEELTREMLGMPVRIGIPTNLTGLSEAIDSPPYATCVGLVRWGLRHGMSAGTHGTQQPESGNWKQTYGRFKMWLREFLP